MTEWLQKNVVLLTTGKAAEVKPEPERNRFYKWLERFQAGKIPTAMLFSALTLFLLAIILFPLIALFSKAFLSQSGEFVGLENYARYFSTPSLSVSLSNTITVSTITALCSTLLGFGYAYALTRTDIRGKTFFRYIALLPIFMPTAVDGLGLVYIFGRQGLLTALGITVPIYGAVGIILSEIIYTFPSSYLMFSIALAYNDGRLYEAAESLGVGKASQFFRITVPQVKYTLINAAFVSFTLAFTDFGAPKVLGGNYNVLATDIYKQIAGQFNMNMGAVVGTLLLIPAFLSFAVDKMVNHKGRSGVSAKATPLAIEHNSTRNLFFMGLCCFVSLCFLGLIAALSVGAFTEYFPYNVGLTLKHFSFSSSTGGLKSFSNSITMSLVTAVCGTAVVFLYAYLMEKTRGFHAMKNLGRLLSSLPAALPGMVIGLSFIFFFNAKSNPFNFIYGTMIILVLANILHFYAVPYITATSALKKLDKEYESVAQSMRIPGYITFARVTVPMSLEAILEIFMYFFVNSMVTVSALVFLYSAKLKIASIAITHMEEAGDVSQAAAMSLLILAVNIGVRILYECILAYLRKKRNKTGIQNAAAWNQSAEV